MSPDEFLALPPSLALRVLLEAAPGLVAKLADIQAPPIPRRPRFDFAIYRKDGIQWASETDAEGLGFWRKRYQESADKGGEYAAKDAKRVKAIDAWIAWRMVESSAPWSGERNDAEVTAAPPSARPRVYPKRANGSSDAAQDSAPDSSGGSGDAGDFNY